MFIIFFDIVIDWLKLVVFILDDLEFVFRYFLSEDVIRFMDISLCKDRDEVEDIIRFYLEDMGCCWGIFSKSDVKLIGICGFYCWV